MEIKLEELLKAGVHFGHQRQRWSPKMKPYIFDLRNNTHIIDLVKTKQKLIEAIEFLQQLQAEHKTILLVGTKKQAADAISEMAEKTKLPYVNSRWLGGTLTNFNYVKKSLDRLKQLKQDLESGTFENYTKKEKKRVTDEIARMEKVFGGMINMTRLPEALFLIDPAKERVVVREANKVGIPVVALIDTNADPSQITYPIPGNDDALKSVRLICSILTAALSAETKPVKTVIKEKEKK